MREHFTRTPLLNTYGGDSIVIPLSPEGSPSGALPGHAVPYIVKVGGRLPSGAAGAYIGAHVRFTEILGGGRRVEYSIENQAREFSGVAVALQIDTRLEGTSPANAAQLFGEVSWSIPNATVKHRAASDQASLTLSFAQATIDGAITGDALITAVPGDVDAVGVDVDELTAGGAMVPVTLFILGRRAISGLFFPLFNVTVGPRGASNGGASFRQLIDPGQIDGIGYQVVNFPAVGGGAATMRVWYEAPA